jgi:hypothetical protein
MCQILREEKEKKEKEKEETMEGRNGKGTAVMSARFLES